MLGARARTLATHRRVRVHQIHRTRAMAMRCGYSEEGRVAKYTTELENRSGTQVCIARDPLENQLLGPAVLQGLLLLLLFVFSFFLFCFDKTIKKRIKKNVMHKFPDQAGREHNVHIFFF